MLVKLLLLSFTLTFGQAWPACSPQLPLDNCQCDYGHCHWWGDPHTNTFDGLWHHFQGNPGDTYRYVSPCTSDFNLVPFQILATHTPCGASLTCTASVEIRLYDPFGPSGANYDRSLELNFGGSSVADSTGVVPVPGVPEFYGGSASYYIFTQTLGGGIEIAVYTGILCSFPNQNLAPLRPDFVVYTTNSHLTHVGVRLNDYYQYLVCGLCGYYSGTTIDDFTIQPTCLQYNTVGLPIDWSSYTPADWTTVNNFGLAWGDYGPYVRRLESGQNQPEMPTLNPVQCNQARNICQNQFVQVNSLDPEFCDVCASEACARVDNDCGGDINQCVQQFCPDGCAGIPGCA